MTSYCGAVYICICVYLFQEARLQRYCCVYLCLYLYLCVSFPRGQARETSLCICVSERTHGRGSLSRLAQWEGFELGESVAKGLNRVVISCRTHLDIISIIEMRWRGKKPAKMPSESWGIDQIWNMKIWTPGHHQDQHQHQLWSLLQWLLQKHLVGLKRTKVYQGGAIAVWVWGNGWAPAHHEIFLIFKLFPISQYIHFFWHVNLFYICLLKWPFWGKDR